MSEKIRIFFRTFCVVCVDLRTLEENDNSNRLEKSENWKKTKKKKNLKGKKFY